MRKELEDLIFEGKMENEVEIYGKKWTIKGLSSAEQLDATKATSNYETLTRIYALKMEVLSRSLTKVNDIELTDKSERFEFVKKLPSTIILKLYNEYEKLQNEQNKLLNNEEELKN